MEAPSTLRSTFPPDIAEPLITLIGLCTAAYHAEFIEIDRVVGDPISERTMSRQAMRSIQTILDSAEDDWNTYVVSTRTPSWSPSTSKPINTTSSSSSSSHLSKSHLLNPGYLWPFLLYAIEGTMAAEPDLALDLDPSTNLMSKPNPNPSNNEIYNDHTAWAIEKMKQIANPAICRSLFFAAFARALADAQLRKERRVTSKYFCEWYFGVGPPFL